jgi:hypothetical protein
LGLFYLISYQTQKLALLQANWKSWDIHFI